MNSINNMNYDKLFIDLNDEMTELCRTYYLDDIFDYSDVYLSGSYALKLICEDAPNIDVNDLDIYIKNRNGIHIIINKLLNSGYKEYFYINNNILPKITKSKFILQKIKLNETTINSNGIITVIKLYNFIINKYLDIIIFANDISISDLIYKNFDIDIVKNYIYKNNNEYITYCNNYNNIINKVAFIKKKYFIDIILSSITNLIKFINRYYKYKFERYFTFYIIWDDGRLIELNNTIINQIIKYGIDPYIDLFTNNISIDYENNIKFTIYYNKTIIKTNNIIHLLSDDAKEQYKIKSQNNVIINCLNNSY